MYVFIVLVYPTLNDLAGLMREPVLADKRTEHARFCEHAQSIIWRVCGKPGTMALRNPVVRAPPALDTYRVCLNIFLTKNIQLSAGSYRREDENRLQQDGAHAAYLHAPSTRRLLTNGCNAIARDVVADSTSVTCTGNAEKN